MLYLARALGCVVGLPFKQLNKKYALRKKLKLMIMKEVILFLACIVCIQPCLLSNATNSTILPRYKSSSHYINLGRPGLVGVKNKLKYLALHILYSCFVLLPGSPWAISTISLQNRKTRIKFSFKSPPKALLRFL